MDGPPAVDLTQRWLRLDLVPEAEYPDRLIHHTETRRLLDKWLAMPESHRDRVMG